MARHPLRERLRAVHIRALYRAGLLTDALASYDDLRRRLADELGLDPGPELAALHAAVLRRDPALDAAGASAASVQAAGLAAPLTELIGRDHTIDRVRSLLGSARLVTLVGAGGVGKTRIALETASRMAPALPDGVRVVELAGLPGRAAAPATVVAVAEVVAAALGIRDDTGPAALVERLGEALRTTRTLLVLDNCEHVAEPAAELAAVLLRTAPGLRILATSHEPLRLAGEQLCPVAPLDVPGPQAGTEPAALLRYGAVRLFVARAAAADPGFALRPGNAEAVRTVCRRLDGIPLALELAATRVRALGVHELATRLDDRFRLLATGQRGAPSRQRSLRAVLDWSWELLTDPERAVLRRLAAHVDGCTLDAVEAVGAGDGVRAEEVPDLLARLVDRSLVVPVRDTDHGGDDGAPDGTRYRLLESVAAYSAERLHDAGECRRVDARHRAHYLALAESADARLRGPGQRRWLRRLDAEAGNLRAALDTAIRDDAADEALRLVGARAWYWVLRGRLGEAHRSLTAALAVDGPAHAALRAAAAAWQAGVAVRLGADHELAPDGTAPDAPPAVRAGLARAQWFLAHARIGFGELPASEEVLERAAATFDALGDDWGAAAAAATRAKAALTRGDLPAVRRHGERSAVLFRELGDPWGRLQATFSLGSLAQITGGYAAAARLHGEAARIAEGLGMWTDLSDNLCQLGRTALLQGDHDEAGRHHERARLVAVEHGYVIGEEFAEVGLALGERRRGALDAAETRLRRWLGWDRRMGSDVGLALILAKLGFVAELRGDGEAAQRLHEEGLDAARRAGDRRAVALALEGLAGAHSLAGRNTRAAELLERATRIRAEAGVPLPPAECADVDRITARLRSARTAVVAEPGSRGQ